MEPTSVAAPTTAPEPRPVDPPAEPKVATDAATLLAAAVQVILLQPPMPEAPEVALASLAVVPPVAMSSVQGQKSDIPNWVTDPGATPLGAPMPTPEMAAPVDDLTALLAEPTVTKLPNLPMLPMQESQRPQDAVTIPSTSDVVDLVSDPGLMPAAVPVAVPVLGSVHAKSKDADQLIAEEDAPRPEVTSATALELPAGPAEPIVPIKAKTAPDRPEIAALSGSAEGSTPVPAAPAPSEAPVRAPVSLAAPAPVRPTPDDGLASLPNPVDRVIAHQVLRAARDRGMDRNLVIRLTPPELGTVRVEFRADAHGLQVSLHAEDSAVRRALEQALPQLRADFNRQDGTVTSVAIGNAAPTAEQGRNSGDSSQQDAERRSAAALGGRSRARRGGPAFSLGMEAATAAPAPVQARTTGLGLPQVDTQV